MIVGRRKSEVRDIKEVNHCVSRCRAGRGEEDLSKVVIIFLFRIFSILMMNA